MTDASTLISAPDLAAANKTRHPNESAQYRQARNQLLIAEIELRRQLESVSAQRRALPPGGEVPPNLQFIGESGAIHFNDLFGDKNTLAIYSLMYGPARKTPCPMCTSFLNAWNGVAFNLRQRISIAVTARSSIERLLAFKRHRGLSNLPFFSDTAGDYTRAYVSPDDADVPGFSVFTRRDGVTRHFYSGEMSGEMADPGQDPRGAPDLDLLWQLLDYMPEGRGIDWYPKLEYPSK